jgi:recombination associated protein RdgC
MWFRNLLVYRIARPWQYSAENFAESLSRHALQPCASFAMESRGWVSPRDDDRYVYAQQGQWLIALGVHEKLLPASVIRQAAEERAADVERRQGHPVGRKQMRDLRAQMADELLPRALTRRRTTRAWIDTRNQWLALDLGAEAKADAFVETLRRSEDGLPPIVRLDTERAAGAMMTQWIATGEAPEGFSVDRDLELQAGDGSKAVVRYANHSLEGGDIRSHIRDGKTATRLGMTWQDRISFVLTAQMQIRRIQFLDVLRSEVGDDAQDDEERFETDFALMTGELSKCLTDLTAALGGIRT